MKNFKKLSLSLLVLSAFLFSSLKADAQYREVRLGLKIAPNLGWLKPKADKYENNGTKIGFSWGFIAEKYFAENYAIVSGLNVHFANGSLKFPYVMPESNEPGVMERSFSFKYIEIPVMAKMKTNELVAGLKFYGNIGLAPGIKMQAKAKDSFKNSTIVNSDKYTANDLTSVFRLSMIVGCGVEFDIDKSTTLFAGINFNNGLTNALKTKNKYLNISHNAISNFLDFNIGVFF